MRRALVAATCAVALVALPATASAFVVDNTGDLSDANPGDGGCDTAVATCTLRAAIEEANALAGADAITFNISAGGLQTIVPAAPLPAITEQLSIDGTTQPGFTADPLIELNGTNQSTGNGLSVQAASSLIKGLIINNAPADGIAISAASVTVDNCWIGTSNTGLAASANGGNGILITTGADSAVIGSAGSVPRNVISGNTVAGIEIAAGSSEITGNYIGTDKTGMAAVANATGISVDTPSVGNVLGGTAAGDGNVISGNNTDGIRIINSASNQIWGNTIGLAADGVTHLPNTTNGVHLAPAANTEIGGAGAIYRNVISANTVTGVLVENGSNGTVIAGNYIGVAADGTGTGYAMVGNHGNGLHGVDVQSQSVTVGGAAAGAGNVVSGSGNDGIRVVAAGAVVLANLVGTDATGLAAAGNGNQGVRVDNVGSATVGAPGAGNVIADSGSQAVRIASSANVVVQGNMIGTDKNSGGGAAFGNGGTFASVGIFTSSNSVIGGTAAGEANVIANSTGGADGVAVIGGSGNRIRANSIHDNEGLGIDIEDDGVTPNDADDVDTIGNNGQNFPVVTSASRGGGTLKLAGTLDAPAGAAMYAVDVFASAACDASGNGEGPDYVGSFNVSTDANGDATFAADVATSVDAGKDVITTTATSPTGDTSEFSACATALPAGQLQLSAASYSAAEGDGTATITVTRTGGSSGATTVDYATADGTALAGSDYVAVSGTLAFAAGQTSKTFAVAIADDAAVESAETLQVTLSNAPFAPLGSPTQATLTITDNDTAPAPGGGTQTTTTPTTTTPTPGPGTGTTPTTTPPPVTTVCKVPRLKGLTRAKAKRKLARAHCRLGKVKKQKTANKRLRGKVLKQKPAPGKRLKAGSKVAVTLGR